MFPILPIIKSWSSASQISKNIKFIESKIVTNIGHKRVPLMSFLSIVIANGQTIITKTMPGGHLLHDMCRPLSRVCPLCRGQTHLNTLF